MTLPAHRVQPDIAAALAQTRGADVRGVAAAGLTWITMAQVGEAERGWLDAHFNVHPLAMDDLTSRNQRPKVDDYGASLFIVLYFPKPSTDPERLTAVELNMLVGDDYVVSVPRSGMDVEVRVEPSALCFADLRHGDPRQACGRNAAHVRPARLRQGCGDVGLHPISRERQRTAGSPALTADPLRRPATRRRPQARRRRARSRGSARA